MEPRAILDPETTPAADEKHAPFVQSAIQPTPLFVPTAHYKVGLSPPPWVSLFQEASAAHTTEEDERHGTNFRGGRCKKSLSLLSHLPTYLRRGCGHRYIPEEAFVQSL